MSLEFDRIGNMEEVIFDRDLGTLVTREGVRYEGRRVSPPIDISTTLSEIRRRIQSEGSAHGANAFEVVAKASPFSEDLRSDLGIHRSAVYSYTLIYYKRS